MERGEEIRKHLFSLSARGIKYDLERMRDAAAAIGNPQRTYPCVHVAGTNGKGSVCAYLESCLRASGLRTGLFTSPHLVRFEERFMIGGMPVHEPVWLESYRDLQPVIDRFRLTFFEASTLIAFEIFKRNRVEWAVLETGLGGRLDATNVVVPAVSVISRIALDHKEYLGNDLASIFYEKLGIVKKGIPLVIAEPEDGRLRALVRERCNALDAPFYFVNKNEADGCVIDAVGASFLFHGQDYRINLAGEFQVSNALCALSALKAAGVTAGHAEAVVKGMDRTRLPGRFHTMNVKDRTVVFDVGHNPDAAMTFCRALKEKYKGQSVCFVLGIMNDKDIAGMLVHYAAAAGRIICTAPVTERAAPAETIKNLVPGDFKGRVSAASTIVLAIEEAFASKENVICIAGSFFTVGEAMGYLDIDPYKY
jgi:dihydrofolate synthase / folylpolyglutamate synthase